MTNAAARAPSISVILPLVAPLPGLETSLEAWARHLGPEDQVLLVCQGQAAQEQARGLPADLTAMLKILAQPPQETPQEPAARVLGLAEARGEVALFSLPACQPGPELLPRLRQAFARPDLAGLAGAVEPLTGGGTPAGLAGLELSWQQAHGVLPHPACLALRRRVLLETGGLDPSWSRGSADLWQAWLVLERGGRSLEQDPACQVRMPQPDAWGALLGRAREQGRDLFLGRRLGAGSVLGADKPALQVLLVLAAPGLLLALWGPSPERAVTLAAICLLLLYPLNRPFVLFVAEQDPPALWPAMLFCLLRPWAWVAGLLGEALGRLGGQRPGAGTNSS